MNEQQTELAAQLGQALKQRGWRVTCAESCTGGGVAAAITAISGSSDWFDAGFVTYSNAMKQRLLKVSADTLNSLGAVSQAVVEQMANGAIELAGANIAVAVSGIAGPDGGSADKPVGTVWFAWAGPDSLVTKCCLFSGDRAAVREQAVSEALRGLLALCY
ncbi:CinA family protein [Porticoccaceae bacterium LTM1]|nr:CinA family protein [Porticoccaceae bacterium LTM1]